MRKIGKWLYDELLAGRSWFDWAFLTLGLICQLIAYIHSARQPIELIAGLFGIISVYLCAQGKISMFLFGIINILTYAVVSYRQQLYGEVAINLFYFSAQLYGIWNWRRHYREADNQQSGHLVARSLRLSVWLSLIALAIVASLGTGYYLDHYTEDSDPYFDAFTTCPAFIAEILMVMGFRQQWYLWFLIDIGCIWMWLRAGNWPMATLKMFWCINCIYGYIQWSKNASKINGK